MRSIMPKPSKTPLKPMAGKNGGVLSKVAAGKMGHSQAPVTPVRSDRGNFSIKG